MKPVKKGQFGYIKYRRRFHLCFAVLLYAMAVALYIAGIKATGDNKNLLTVVAILGVLPASQSLVTTILGLRAKNCSRQLYEKTKERTKEDSHIISLYDLYFTTYDKNYPVNHMVIKNNCLCAIMDESRHSSNELHKYLEDMFQKNGIKGFTIKIYEKSMEEKYLNRMDELTKLEPNINPMQDEAVHLLCDISY